MNSDQFIQIFILCIVFLYLSFYLNTWIMITTSKRILITGGTSGLGIELVKHFLATGNEVYTIGRDLKDISLNDRNFHFIKCDLANLNSLSKTISELCEQVKEFDIVINNAGVLGPSHYVETQDGFEYTFQINFLSHFLIDEMIVKARKSVDPLLIISVTSPVYKYVKPDFTFPELKNFHSFQRYSESKVYILFIGEYLTKKYPGRNIKYFGLKPGIFSSGISRMKKKWLQRMYMIGAPFMRKPGKIADSLISILERNNFINGKIYRGEKNYRELKYTDQLIVDTFIEAFHSKIEKYIG
jgi:NAD(P)-dependent dehydrogenase (short-subunit alcohol dehydrogenase family)